jgi:hypothetical protein
MFLCSKDDVRYSGMTLRHELARLVQGHIRECAKILTGKGPESCANMQTDQAAAQDMWGRCLVGIHLEDQQVCLYPLLNPCRLHIGVETLLLLL